MTRIKDVEVIELARLLAQFESRLGAYASNIAAELATARSDDAPRTGLVAGLERHDGLLKALVEIVDGDIWDHMIMIANMSASVSHRRTGRFF